MTIIKTICVAAMFSIVAAPVQGQGRGPVYTPIPTPVDRHAIPLPTDGPVGLSNEIWVETNGQRMVRNVSQPTLTPVLPDPAKATGAAVIIAPGGAFMILSIDNEGFTVARWLADRGIAAFVLKYRTEITPADPKSFGRQIGMRMGAIGAGSAVRLTFPSEGAAREDGLAAIRLVRRDAAKWGVDPARVGLMGFSAGAKTALNVALAKDGDARPDFVAPIYPSMDARAIPAGMPPMFTAIASDDPLYGNKGFGLVQAWQKAGAPAELHVFDKGGHGFGFAPQGTTSDHWLTEFLWWLEARGLLKAK